MTTQHLSHSITVELGPTFGSDIDRVRKSQVSWLDGMTVSNDPIFAVEQPVELVGVSASGSSDTSVPLPSPASSLTFVPAGERKTRGIMPDSHIVNQLRSNGSTGMCVDSLSRSVLITDVDERTVIDAIQAQADVNTDSLNALKRDLLVPKFYDDLPQAKASQATALLKKNVRRHEREHVRCLLNPETAIWNELEVYWRSVLLGKNPRTWNDPSFLSRFADLYTIPSQYTIELLAMARERYAAADSAVEQAVKSEVASQRGTEQVLLQRFRDHGIDQDTLIELLRSPVSEQYTDLWLMYILTELQAGRSLDKIEVDQFHTTYSPSLAAYDGAVGDQKTQSLFAGFMREWMIGPVFELVRLTFTDGQFVLERAWYSMNPDISDAECLLAVRRALFQREFIATFGVESGLDDLRMDRQMAVERTIHDESFKTEVLFDRSVPSSDQLSTDVKTAYESTASTLLGPHATTDDLCTWLNDPQYGFTDHST